MLKAIIPPFCFLLALALAITGFSMLAFGGPEESVSLHAARASGDELATETLEGDLETRQSSRVMLITTLFVGSGMMAIIGFYAIGETASNRT